MNKEDLKNEDIVRYPSNALTDEPYGKYANQLHVGNFANKQDYNDIRMHEIIQERNIWK